MSREVVVPPHRLERWLTGFTARNGVISSIEQVDDDTVVRTADGGQAVIHGACVDARDAGELAERLLGAGSAAVVLLRRGGYSIALARFHGAQHEVGASKTGSRYVQGRTAAGGQSQQRFARRRANQAAALVGSAAVAARTVLGDHPGAVDLLIAGGDQPLLDQLLASSPLSDLAYRSRVHVQVGEPRRATVDEAIELARSMRITVRNAAPG